MQEKWLISALTLCLVAACGGSDGDSNTAADPTPRGQTKQNKIIAPESPAGEWIWANKRGGEYRWSDALDGYSHYNLTVDGQSLASEDRGAYKLGINSMTLPRGFYSGTAQTEYRSQNDANKKRVSQDLALRSFRGFYAGAYAYGRYDGDPNMDIGQMYYTTPTPYDNLPTSGRALYVGRVFDYNAQNDAKLNYVVDFSKHVGSGEVGANTLHEKYKLEEAPIGQHEGLYGTYYGVKNGEITTQDRYSDGKRGTYNLIISGTRAEEITGDLNYIDPYGNPAGQQVFHAERGEVR
ncbi:lipoprotein GNA1870 [Cardiobacterium hominis]|jgi:lipoprotein GNA1870|uniref:Factor H binding protein-like C-terminal domain-containing protein n=2 Tax=Cardiobacterium hominis TaxID=2718 RepID=C8N8G5_CARH6|nr:lipoprotein GNA1870 [Cardiobacterium hominis]EEV89118.1 hypothetical protein HMPREF0198_0792 [Cardiobacterium hominis ATCC 15826]SAM72285.1 TolA protein [Cardiobacterium hominis]VEG77400.1 Lipoprotein GNA1870 C terminal like [Cardiobacterium hominis]